MISGDERSLPLQARWGVFDDGRALPIAETQVAVQGNARAQARGAATLTARRLDRPESPSPSVAGTVEGDLGLEVHGALDLLLQQQVESKLSIHK